jgi:serine/threonine protein kinase
MASAPIGIKPLIANPVETQIAWRRTPLDERVSCKSLPDVIPNDIPAPTAFEAETLRPIQAIGGYRLVRVLGRGGMGIVYQAEDVQLNRMVAIKLMNPVMTENTECQQRFLREARVQASIDHANVVPIYQIGVSDGSLFIVMPMLKGQTLAERLQLSGNPTVAEVMRIGSQIAEGLAAAHELGLIHRDIKPSNIWLEEPSGQVKIFDFGLAREAFETANNEPLTGTGMTVGTVDYMSPEQARGLPLDARSDLFCVGVILFQMLTGSHPFRAHQHTATIAKLVAEPLPTLHEFNLNIPQELAELVDDLLARDVTARPSSARRVADDLRRIANGESRTHTPLAVPASQPSLRHSIARTLALGLLLIGGVFAAQVITIRTPNGTLVLESDDPNVEVVVKKNGAVVMDRTNNREITLAVGEYGIELAEKKDGLRLNTDKFEITRNGTAIVRATLEKPKVQPPIAAKPEAKPTPAPTPTPVVSRAADPDRTAAEVFINDWILQLRIRSTGTIIQLPPRTPPPSEPFDLVGLIGFRDEPTLDTEGYIASTLLPTISQCRSFERIGKNIPYSAPGMANAITMTKHPNFANWTNLCGYRMPITPETAPELAKWRNMQFLSLRVDQSHCHLMDDMMKQWRALEMFWIRFDGTDSQQVGVGLEALSRCGVKQLWVQTATPVPSAAWRNWGESKHQQVLVVTQPITREGIEALLKSTSLEQLSVQRQDDRDAIPAFARLAKKLKVLDLDYTKLTEDEVRVIASAAPQCRVTLNQKHVAAK